MTSIREFLHDTSYRALPPEFFAPAPLFPAPAPQWAVYNQALAAEFGLPEDARGDEWLTALSGGAAPHGENIALAYSGHQFGQWNPRLGDGRAAMIGEMSSADGVTYDVHLKGSGPTLYARRGDGRATLSAMLREFLISEAMAGLNIPTTRALAVTATGAPVFRDARGRPGAVLTRIARSHVRVGTFQYAAAQDGKRESGPVLVKALADHCIARLYPEIADGPEPYLAFYAAVVARQARLVAQWMLAGFIHGVMNTDNMSISGETIDFGPCAFMDSFNRRQVFSSIDASGRYAYNRQAPVASWNLARLAETLLPLFDQDDAVALRKAQDTLEGFQPAYVATLSHGLERKLGLRPHDPANEELVAAMWRLLDLGKTDYTLFFRRLTRAAAGANAPEFLALFEQSSDEAREEAQKFLAKWRVAVAGPDFPQRVAAMQAANPIVIARNHRVEQALAAAEDGDFAPALRLAAALKNPFAEPPAGGEDLEAPPRPEEVVLETFCGT